MFYKSLIPAYQTDVQYIYTNYKKSVADGIAAANFILSLMNMDYAIGVAASVLGTILDCAYNCTNVTRDQMMEILTKECGVIVKDERWTCTSGLLIEEYFNSAMLTMTTYYYYANNDSVRKGVSGAKGTWSK